MLGGWGSNLSTVPQTKVTPSMLLSTRHNKIDKEQVMGEGGRIIFDVQNLPLPFHFFFSNSTVSKRGLKFPSSPEKRGQLLKLKKTFLILNPPNMFAKNKEKKIQSLIRIQFSF